MRVINPIAKRGEDIACEYLKNHAYSIVERNFHARGGEIDIIAIDQSGDDPILCFVEVKTRTSDQFGSPFEAITYWKIKALRRTAIYYTILHKNLPKSLRIDAISVVVSNQTQLPTVELIKNIAE